MGDAASIAGGLLRNTISRISQRVPLDSNASRARIAYGQRRKEYSVGNRGADMWVSGLGLLGLVLGTKRCRYVPACVCRPALPASGVRHRHFSVLVWLILRSAGSSRPARNVVRLLPLHPAENDRRGRTRTCRVQGRGRPKPAHRRQNIRLAATVFFGNGFKVFENAALKVEDILEALSAHVGCRFFTTMSAGTEHGDLAVLFQTAGRFPLQPSPAAR